MHYLYFRFTNLVRRNDDEEEADGGDVDLKSDPVISIGAHSEKDEYEAHSDVKSHRST